MSRSGSADQEEDHGAAVCDFCGFVIDEARKPCPARDEGVWRS